MGIIFDWLTSFQLSTLTAGVALGATGIGLFRWVAQKLRYNRLPLTGEPRVFVGFLRGFENGALLEVEIRNIDHADI
ncbi:hypothetical protein [Mesorhizobium sp. INR15]|uniref:hypothetical protein n=1 Tax=Mesorhizobium sp. INR15 TaxID=2654248 RepID=UPI0018967883|nr:hypothetical protein [Mesorhizobium sp. INR15]QPC93545.1 hypothetical protein GA829_24855 [Mesorhizobium sp. INR15]